jgi:uncharacterized protein YndB with AHSA1/START domain
MEYRAQVTIEAKPGHVWAALTDFKGWEDWEENTISFDGNATKGGVVTLTSKLQPKRPFVLTVETLVMNEKLVLTSGMPLGMFNGVRTYTLTSLGDATQVDVHEVYSGWMLPLMKGQIPDLQPSFDAFVSGLKRRVEG